jgi:hypothetical protein
MPDHWSRLADESAEAYAAFNSYRQLGPARTLNKAYQAHTGRIKGAPGTWRHWARRHDWEARALAADQHEHDVRQAAADKVVAEDEAGCTAARLEQIRLERDWHRIIDAKIREMEKFPICRRRVAVDDQGRTVTVHEPTKWTLKTMLDFIRFGSQLGRVINKMPTVVETAPADDFRDLFFETDGQLDAALPEGAMPPMPADVMEKPVIDDPSGNGNGHQLRQQPPPRFT